MRVAGLDALVQVVLFRSRYTADNGAADRVDWVLEGGLLDTVANVTFDQEQSVSFADERRRSGDAMLRSIRVEAKEDAASAR